CPPDVVVPHLASSIMASIVRFCPNLNIVNQILVQGRFGLFNQQHLSTVTISHSSPSHVGDYCLEIVSSPLFNQPARLFTFPGNKISSCRPLSFYNDYSPAFVIYPNLVEP